MELTVQHDVSLQRYNSMSVPAQAKCLVKVTTVHEAQTALRYASDNGLPILVLGEGSNTLFKDDFQGLVILNRLLGRELISETSDSAVITAGAGENWHQFVAYTLENQLFGLQNLSLIPGLVGAAPMQNIGAYGVEVKDTLVSVDYIDIASGEQQSLSNSECCFGYRDSVFKSSLASKTLVTAVTFRLSKKTNVNLTYPALAAMFDAGSQPSPRQVFDAVCRVRRLKLPLPKEVPNTGSFFKNPTVDATQHQLLKDKYPDLVSFAAADQFKLAAGWLIEQAGWKSRELAGVRVHPQQALVIINPDQRKGKVVLQFAKTIQTDIYDKFGVTLEIEPRVYG